MTATNPRTVPLTETMTAAMMALYTTLGADTKARASAADLGVSRGSLDALVRRGVAVAESRPGVRRNENHVTYGLTTPGWNRAHRAARAASFDDADSAAAAVAPTEAPLTPAMKNGLRALRDAGCTPVEGYWAPAHLLGVTTGTLDALVKRGLARRRSYAGLKRSEFYRYYTLTDTGNERARVAFNR